MSAGTSEFFCLICLLVCSCTAQENIRAKRGQDVILPCKVPNNNILITAVGWSRPDQDPDYVLLYRDGRFDPHSQHPSYQNRVDLQDKEMKDGNVSLILKNVTMEDTGKYVCRVSQEGKTEPFSIINLEVHPPAHKITAKRGQDVILPCKVPNINDITALQWIRPGLDPDYVLLYQNKRLYPDNQHPSYQNRVDLQDKEMKDGDVSLILMNVKMEDTGAYECFAFHETKNELISIINLEVLPPDHSWKIIVCVFGVFTLLIPAFVFAVYKLRQNRKKKKKMQKEIQQLERSYSETKNQLQQKTQENEALINQQMKLEGNNSDTINPLQKKKLKNRTPMNRLKTRSYSDDRSVLQLVKERNETLNSHLMKLEKLQDENQKLKETVGNLQTKLQNMNQEGELMGTKTAEHVPE